MRENELEYHKADHTHGTELPNGHHLLANRWAYAQPSGISLHRREAEQMNRKRTPAQPFNYGKDGKGVEIKSKLACRLGRNGTASARWSPWPQKGNDFFRLSLFF